MKKITFLSILTATMLVTGCNNTTTKEAANKAAEATSSAVDTLKNKASEMAQTAKDKAAEAVTSAKEKAAQLAEDAKAKAEETAGTMKEKAAEAVEATKTKAAEMTEAVKEKTAPASEERMPENPDVAAPSTQEASSAAPVDSAQGKALYAKCAGCHGADGKTKALGKSDVIAGVGADVITEDLKGYKAGTLNKHGMGTVMQGQAAGLSDADIAALSAYITSLK